VRSATEIEARREEKLLMLPVIKRLDKEVLAPAIERVWGIMMRGNLLPKPIPPEIVGHLIGIKYISPFAMAMLAAETTAIERLWAFGGNIAAVKPGILDNLDEDSSIHIYADSLGTDPAHSPYRRGSRCATATSCRETAGNGNSADGVLRERRARKRCRRLKLVAGEMRSNQCWVG
jgi:hypothetical protein